MDIKAVTVTNRDGLLETNGTSDKGTIILYSDKDQYAICIANNDPETKNEVKVKKVTITTPLGGKDAGLFRYPRVGENILVVQDSNNDYYMIASVPNKDQSFDTNEAAEYKNVEHKNVEHRNAVHRWIKQEGASIFRSTNEGKRSEIRMGKTIQILSNCFDDEGTYKTEEGELKKTYDRGIAQGALYADKDGDEPVEEGVNIRAGGKIVIRAGEEIELRVGHSAIRITDWGITLTSRKAKRPIALPWDSTIKLGPFGLFLFGSKIEAKAGYGFNISDLSGDCIEAEAGCMKMTGKDITIASISHVHYLLNEFLVLLEEGARVNLATLKYGESKENSYSPWAEAKLGSRSFSSLAKGSLGAVFTLPSMYEKVKKAKEGGNVWEAILSVFELLDAVVDLIFEGLAEEDKRYNGKNDNKDRLIQLMTGHEIYHYSMVVLPIINMVVSAKATWKAWNLIKRATVHLSAGAELELMAADYKAANLTNERLESPFAGAPAPAPQ